MSSSTTDFGVDPNGLSYLKYISTFAQQDPTVAQITVSENEDQPHDDLGSVFVASKDELTRLNLFELNELVEQIETTSKILSDTLVHELALREELEFEKETRNTFISLLMSIQVLGLKL